MLNYTKTYYRKLGSRSTNKTDLNYNEIISFYGGMCF